MMARLTYAAAFLGTTVASMAVAQLLADPPDPAALELRAPVAATPLSDGALIALAVLGLVGLAFATARREPSADHRRGE